jgi:hypothetical protein
LRRAELIALKLTHLQQRDNHWAIIDLYGKGGHICLETTERYLGSRKRIVHAVNDKLGIEPEVGFGWAICCNPEVAGQRASNGPHTMKMIVAMH